METIQIVPRLPPAINGVGDYAFLLARELRAAHDIHSHFIVCDPDWENTVSMDGFPIRCVPARRASDLDGLLERMLGSYATVLLHYVGYGYDKRGSPFWLVEGLEQWRRRLGGRRLVTMFHELYAFGLPWRSSFWTMPLQRSIAARLAELSDRCRTNTTRSARMLECLAPSHRGRVVVQPVFSNVGELDNPPPIDARQPWMLVFGSNNWVRSSFTRYRDELIRACSYLGVKKILVIGQSRRNRADFPVPVETLGFLPPDSVSRWMQQAQAGFTSYPSHCLGKSGIFAAYAAHGILPVVAREGENDDGLAHGQTMTAADSLSSKVPFEEIAKIPARATNWYRHHNVRETASSYCHQLANLLNVSQTTTARITCS